MNNEYNKAITFCLTPSGFNKAYLHYESDIDKYYVFINTKKHNRNLKRYIKVAQKYVVLEKHLLPDTIIPIKIIGYRNWLKNNGV